MGCWGNYSHIKQSMRKDFRHRRSELSMSKMLQKHFLKNKGLLFQGILYTCMKLSSIFRKWHIRRACGSICS